MGTKLDLNAIETEVDDSAEEAAPVVKKPALIVLASHDAKHTSFRPADAEEDAKPVIHGHNTIHINPILMKLEAHQAKAVGDIIVAMVNAVAAAAEKSGKSEHGRVILGNKPKFVATPASEE